MSHTGATGPRRFERSRATSSRETIPRRSSGPVARSLPPSRPPRITAFDPTGEIRATDNRAAARAALADSFAARFGVDETGPSADTLADRFGFRYERSDSDPTLPTGRRTVTITGHGAGRAVPPAERAPRGGGRPSARSGAGLALRADRVALIAVGLGLLLAFLAATSAHALVAVH